MSTGASDAHNVTSVTAGGDLDVERDSDVPISTQIYWQLAYQIDSGRLLPGARLPPVRELGAALRVNPNTIRAVYRRLADADYVTSRHGAGTHVAERPPQRRGTEALAGIVAEMLRRAAHAGFTADEVAAATFAAATERKRPGPLVRVLFAECTSADAGYDAERLVQAFPGMIEAEGALIDDLPDRLDRFHYDLVATTTFHADECQVLAAGRVPVVAMLVGPGYLELVHEIAGLPAGSTVGLVCANERGAENMRETLQLSGATGIDIIAALIGEPNRLAEVDEGADLVLMSREALAAGLDRRLARPDRIRPWTYEFDPSGLELLRRAVDHVAADRPRAFHVRRTARARYGIGADLIGIRGDLVVADAVAIRKLAARMDAERPAGAPGVLAGEIAALGLLHEIGHLLIARFAETRRPGAMARALDQVREQLGPDAEVVLDRFAAEFPGRGPAPEPAVERLEELLLIRIANENPALGMLRELVDDQVLADGTRYAETVAGLERAFGDDDELLPGGGSLIELMRAPARAAPTSLIGQLRYVREHWGGLLGDVLDSLLLRLDIAIGILAEEERGLHQRFGGGGGVVGGDVHPPSFAGAGGEPEAFSSDSAWMPRLVLIAKSTYVWLDQLSRRYGRDIRTLDAIPDEELDQLAGWGITGLWLIGLWQRSVASERIKRMRGNADAVASAYSLDDYRIADDLGGEPAHANLRERAWARGIRLASDMVPNHMGIDSRWVIDHPEWFLSVPEPPYPAYSYSGADLSPDDRVGVVLEDHYWNDTDAAVTFKRFDRWGGEDRYIYHGNDGTSFPWNDTAQLDFLNPEVREQVIRTIIDVARRFPVIRFDAAMVLAKKHIQRLWWPLPGAGDSIPSRAAHAMPQAAFDARMPVEFWREVVDRVAAEVPGTLLLAEAFWMLEGYFVRTLGMHRVYNSAFMHMLRDENGAGYRRLIKETLEFDPEILKRYVNFMNNPDEKTAVEQFGKGDKYFGVAMVLATMPGLPMLGHGQVEGFGEKYGMEFRRATLDEHPDPWLVERHEREIFPLLHRRSWFAEASDFLLYDLVSDGGGVDEHVLAYSNGSGPTRSLVIYHDRFGSTTGTIRESAAYADKRATGTRRLVRRSLADGLGLPDDPDAFIAFRDARSGLEFLRSCRDLHERGLRLTLEAYQGHAFWEFHDIHDGSSGQWRRLADRLGGGGVPSLESALRDLQLEPVHAPLRAVFAGGAVAAIIDGRASDDDIDAAHDRFTAFLAGVGTSTGVTGDRSAVADEITTRTRTAFRGHAADLDKADRAALLGWLTLSRVGALAPGADVAATSAAWYDELRLAPILAVGFRESGLDEATAWAAADLVRVLLALPRPSEIPGRGAVRDARLIERWAARDQVRAAMGVNTWEGVDWVDRERLETLLTWAARLDAIELDGPADPAVVRRILGAAAAADYRLAGLLPAPPAPPARRTRAPSADTGEPRRRR